MNKSIVIKTKEEMAALLYTLSSNLDMERDMTCDDSLSYQEKIIQIDRVCDLFLAHTVVSNKQTLPFNLVLPQRVFNTVKFVVNRYVDVVYDMAGDQDGDEQQKLVDIHFNLVRLDERFDHV